MSDRIRGGGRRCQVCHKWGEDILSEDSYGPCAGFCYSCAKNFDDERMSRHIRFDNILRSSICGQELTAGDARALGVALCKTALERLRCCRRLPKEPTGYGAAHYSRGKKQCPGEVVGWSQGRFYCSKHYPPGTVPAPASPRQAQEGEPRG